MKLRAFCLLSLVLALSIAGKVNGQNVDRDRDRDILVTFANDGASAIGGGVNPPYRQRIRYSIAASARRSGAGSERLRSR